jgi:D-beta-D-heptose 7-phosphate kinase/D-beta-D-heptose 1-phosphate adenosyltransferase
LTQPELESYVSAARVFGWKIVMTNGVFDLLHVGHVRFLQAARELGDELIVAVNDDASTRRLKGLCRPINVLADRMAVLRALRCVDRVIPFSADTPERLIERMRPDILVKGGDYRPEQIAGGDVVRAYGGKVLALDYHAGYSTTGLLNELAGPAAS